MIGSKGKLVRIYKEWCLTTNFLKTELTVKRFNLGKFLIWTCLGAGDDDIMNMIHMVCNLFCLGEKYKRTLAEDGELCNDPLYFELAIRLGD